MPPRSRGIGLKATEKDDIASNVDNALTDDSLAEGT